MQYTDDRYHLRVVIDSQDCQVPPEELTRMQRLLEPVGQAVEDIPQSELRVKVIRHPRSNSYHVEMKLELPGRSLTSDDRDTYMDSAFQHSVEKLCRQLDSVARQRDRAAERATERRQELDNQVVMPFDSDDGPLADMVRAGDYRAFRTALSTYEEWLRKRVGRWVQRFPEAQARVGDGVMIGDVVEGVYLNAFEQFTSRPVGVRLSEWLDDLIDPTLKGLLREPEEARQSASLARTLRQTPLPS